MSEKGIEVVEILVAVDLLAEILPGARLHLAAILRRAAREMGPGWFATSVLERKADKLIADEALRYRNLSSED